MPALYVKLRPLGCARYQNRLRCARVKSTQKITVHQQYQSSTDDACPRLFYQLRRTPLHRKNHAFPRDYREYCSRTHGSPAVFPAPAPVKNSGRPGSLVAHTLRWCCALFTMRDAPSVGVERRMCKARRLLLVMCATRIRVSYRDRT